MVLTGWPSVATYWLLVVAAGTGLISLLPLRWEPTERLAAGSVVGLVASTLLSFALALAVGVGPLAALL
ncbi:MAG: hypothetical protein WBU92_00560, partial [Candidatus Dormiibacterota bacterium]